MVDCPKCNNKMKEHDTGVYCHLYCENCGYVIEYYWRRQCGDIL